MLDLVEESNQLAGVKSLRVQSAFRPQIKNAAFCLIGGRDQSFGRDAGAGRLVLPRGIEPRSTV